MARIIIAAILNGGVGKAAEFANFASRLSTGTPLD